MRSFFSLFSDYPSLFSFEKRDWEFGRIKKFAPIALKRFYKNKLLIVPPYPSSDGYGGLFLPRIYFYIKICTPKVSDFWGASSFKYFSVFSCSF